MSTSAGQLRSAPLPQAKVGDAVWLALRPEKVRIALSEPASAPRSGPVDGNCVAGQVWDIGYLGDLSIYKVRLDSGFVMKAATANMTRLIERPTAIDRQKLLTDPRLIALRAYAVQRCGYACRVVGSTINPAFARGGASDNSSTLRTPK